MAIATDTEYLSVLSPDDVKFDIHKKNANEVSKLYKREGKQGLQGFMSGSRVVSFDQLSAKISCCGSWLKFAEFVSGTVKLIDARFCHAPNCPMCQWRRSLLWRAKFLALVPTIKEQYPKHRWVFLTLTVRNCQVSDLKTTLKHMRESYNRMRGLADYPFDGYIRSVEVTRAYDWYDKKGNFIARHGLTWFYKQPESIRKTWKAKATDEVHPHFHVLALVPASYFGDRYVKHERWVEMWAQSLRVQYNPSVYIETIKPRKGKNQDITPENLEQDESGLIKAICDTLKYTVKEQDLLGTFEKDQDENSDWLKEYTTQMYLARRLEYSGILKGLSKSIQDEGDTNENLIKSGLEKTEVEEVKRILVCNFRDSLEKYVITSER